MKNIDINILTTIKNNSLQKKEHFVTKYSKHSIEIISSLYVHGYIQSFKVLDQKHVHITLRYFSNKPIFSHFKILSKPSKIRYLKLRQIVQLSTKKFNIFLSTNLGILTLEECKKWKVGGIILFYC